MAQTTPWAAEGLTLSSREEKLAHPPVGDEAASDDAHDGSALPATEAAPRAQPDVLAPTPRPERARLAVATPAPRPRRYATRSSRRGRAD